MEIIWVKNIFDQMMNFKSVFGFLFDLRIFKAFDENEVWEHCTNFHKGFFIVVDISQITLEKPSLSNKRSDCSTYGSNPHGAWSHNKL